MALVTTGVDFTIDQGARFYKQLVWNDENGSPRNLTGYKAHMQIRESVHDVDAKFTLSTESITKDGDITLGGALGTITLDLGATKTATIDGWREGVYDLELFTTTDDVVRLIQGKITVLLEVTRV